MSDRIILDITPQPYVKVIPGESELFYIPERCRYMPTIGRHWRYEKDGPLDLMDVRIMGCELWNNTGFCRHTASKFTRYRKNRIIKYNDYKKKIRELCDAAGFELIPYGWAVYFYYPIPGRWSKKKRKAMHGQHKHNKPDYDNLLKGLTDSLGKKRGEITHRIPDERVSQISGTGKFWVDHPTGYIEILLNQPLYNPFGVDFNDPEVKIYQPI